MSVYNPSGSGDVHVDKSISGGNVPYEIRMSDSRHCVYKKGTEQKFGCHDTYGEALQQMQAIYAKEGGKMGETISYIVNLSDVPFDSDGKQWIHALPFGKYNHPKLGVIDITLEKANRFVENVKKRTRGIDPSVNYNHNNEDKAAGWVKDAQVRSDGLWLHTEWNAAAAQSIKDKEYRYFSAEYSDEWEDNQGDKHQDVIMGGALTNRPFMKNLVPINLSESVIDNAFDLVSGIIGKDVKTLKEGAMDQKDLDTIIEGVTKKLAEQFAPKKDDKNPTPIAKLEEIEEFRKLAEVNPVAKSLLTHFEFQAQAIADSNKKMRETIVDSKLAEFDNSNMVMTPATKELAREIMLSLKDEDAAKFYQFMEGVRTSSNFMVELGERSGAAVRRGQSFMEKSATQEFSERVNALMLNEKVDFLTAAERVAADDPKLYEAYRYGDGAVASK